MDRLREHLENHLGQALIHRVPSQSWVVMEFVDEPMEGCSTYVTNGLRELVVRGRKEKQIRQEYVLSVMPDQLPAHDAVVLLAEIARHAQEGSALLRGSVHAVSNSCLAAFRSHDLYVSAPAYFDDELLSVPSEPGLVLAWLVPLMGAEVAFLANRGPGEFESALEAEDPDLTDLRRAPIHAAARFPDAYAPASSYGFASRLVVEGAPVLLLYRETPDHEQDSGWRFFAGTESDEFLDEPENGILVELAPIAAADSRVRSILGAEVGSLFERENASEDFVQLDQSGRPTS